MAGDLGAVTTADDGLQRGDHLAGILGPPDVAARRHPVGAGLDDGRGLHEHIQRAVPRRAPPAATTMAGVPSTTLANSAVGAGVPGFDDIGAQPGRGPGGV